MEKKPCEKIGVMSERLPILGETVEKLISKNHDPVDILKLIRESSHPLGEKILLAFTVGVALREKIKGGK